MVNAMAHLERRTPRSSMHIHFFGSRLNHTVPTKWLLSWPRARRTWGAGCLGEGRSARLLSLLSLCASSRRTIWGLTCVSSTTRRTNPWVCSTTMTRSILAWSITNASSARRESALSGTQHAPMALIASLWRRCSGRFSIRSPIRCPTP